MTVFTPAFFLITTRGSLLKSTRGGSPCSIQHDVSFIMQSEKTVSFTLRLLTCAYFHLLCGTTTVCVCDKDGDCAWWYLEVCTEMNFLSVFTAFAAQFSSSVGQKCLAAFVNEACIAVLPSSLCLLS